MRTRARSRGGFTILELLVVIFIMMAMTGIAVAAFKQFLDTERIKLAGGQVVSALRMGRQYAMSRRTKVMVEFIDPPAPTEITTHTLTHSEWAWLRGGSNHRNVIKNSGSGALGYCSNSYNGSSAIALRYDLSSLPAGFTVTGAKLHIEGTHSYDTNIKVALVSGPDNWGRPVSSWNDGDENADGGWSQSTIQTVAATAAETSFDIDATIHAVNELESGGSSLSFKLTAVGGHDGTTNAYTLTTATLKVTVSTVVGDVSDTAPRSVRIIPYLRVRDPVTGGFSWLLDQDSGSLKTMELPPNIHYALRPKKIGIEQYDPGDVVDQRVTAEKVFFDLMPDGTCVARPPDVDGWTDRVNTVILHDAMTDDLALLFVPPASSFTRQRYLFGDEVDTFIAANSLYSLW